MSFSTLSSAPIGITVEIGTKSLVAIAAVTTLSATVCVGYLMVRRYAAIGPYPSVNRGNALARIVQRFVQDKTRRDLSCSWFIGQSLLNRVPSRSQNNGHAAAGAVRDEARGLISSTISANGWKRVEISPSKAYPEDYSINHHYAPSDLGKPVTNDIHKDWAVLVGIDVDYYIADPNMYLEYGRPAIFHTFNPVAVAGIDGDCRFRIMDNHVRYEVGGGGDWYHEVWNWCAPGEFIRVECKYQWLPWLLRSLGLQKVVYHKVYHARPWINAPHRVLVWVVPQHSHWEIRFLKSDMHARKLERVKYTDAHRKGWNRIVSPALGKSDGELQISIGRQGEDACATLKKVDFDMLMGLNNAQSVTTRMLQLKYTDPNTMALVGQYFKGDPTYVPECTSLVASSTIVHWPYSTDCDHPEVSSRVYAKPLVDNPNLMPMTKRWETLSMSLEHRVTYVRNTSTPNQSIARLAQEFVELVVPDMNVGHPLSAEEAAAELSKPSQQLAVRQIWETLDVAPRKLIESFVKNEPTMKNGRIISSFPDARFLLMFSRYTLAFRNEVLHSERNQHWFCPGNTPREIAQKVQNYCASVVGVIEGDYSNFDGRVSAWLQQHVMNAVYHRYFGSHYSRELHSYTDVLIKCPARAKSFGFKYDAGVGVKSGSPTTCDLNTVLNAFLMYAAVRKTNPIATKEEAFATIGLAFGDDSLFERQYQKQWVKITDQVGMSLKVEVCKADTGVCFLARVFPDPCSSLTSYQDPLRTWRKLHITTRDPNVPLEDAARDRLEGYLVTDNVTPLTGDYCRMVLRCYGRENERSFTRRQARKDRLKEKPFWLTQGGSWPQSIDDALLMLQNMSARTGIDEPTLRLAIAQCNNCTDVWSGPTLHDTPCDYADGVCPDGTPAEPEVDLVSISTQRDVNHTRANGGSTRSSPGGHRESTGGGERRARTTQRERREDAPRPAELHGMSRQHEPEGAGGNERVAGQAGTVEAPRNQPRGAGAARGDRNAQVVRGRGQRQEPPSARRSQRRQENRTSRGRPGGTNTRRVTHSARE